MVLRITLLISLILLFIKIQICNAGEFEDSALGWLDNKLLTPDDDFDFNRLKIKSTTFEAKNYELNYTRTIADTFSIEANFDLNKSKVRYGTLEQRLSSSEFELASWWQAGDYRVGLSRRMITNNTLKLPNTEEIVLPENKTLGVHMEIPVSRSAHSFVISLRQSTWDMSKSSFLKHADLKDNQLHFNYAMSF